MNSVLKAACPSPRVQEEKGWRQVFGSLPANAVEFPIRQQRFEILLVEDNPSDILLTQQAFQTGALLPHISVANNGEDALQFLRRAGDYQNAPLPDVILLDLNLPKMDGRELLAELKNDPYLRHIPVIVLTTSDSPQDVSSAYRLHANCYLTKPFEVKEFVRKMKSLEDFWLNVVRLPGR